MHFQGVLRHARRIAPYSCRRPLKGLNEHRTFNLNKERCQRFFPPGTVFYFADLLMRNVTHFPFICDIIINVKGFQKAPNTFSSCLNLSILPTSIENATGPGVRALGFVVSRLSAGTRT